MYIKSATATPTNYVKINHLYVHVNKSQPQPLNTTRQSSTRTKKSMEPSPNLKLFGMWASPFVHGVQVALKLKGLQYEYIEEDLDNKSPSLHLYNPVHKKVPVLLHDGRPISESYVILQYIDETWKENPIMPEDPYERAILRFWYHTMADKFGAAMAKVFTASGEDKKAAVSEVLSIWGLLEGEMRDGFFKGKRFFGGERICLLDIVLGVGPQWLLLLEELMGQKLIDPESFPCLYAWIQDFLGQEQVKEVLPPIEKLQEYVKGIHSKFVLESDAKQS